MDVLQAIGSTSLVHLRRVVPPGCAEVLARLEWENPTGSVEDPGTDLRRGGRE